MNKYIEKIAELLDDEETHAKAVARGTRALGRGWLESLAGTAAGGVVGRVLGGAPGAALGGIVGGSAGGLHGIGRSVQNQGKEMSKQASTSLSRYVDRQGLPGSGKNGQAFMGSAALNKSYTGESPVGSVREGGFMKQPIHSLFSGKVVGERTVDNTATRKSGDILARQPSLQDRLAAKRAGTFQAGPGPRVKPSIPGAKPLVGNVKKVAPPAGILQRVMGMAKRHPLLAGIAGAGALGGAAYAAGRSSGQSQPQSVYYQ